MGPPLSAEAGIEIEDMPTDMLNNDVQMTIAKHLESAICNISETDPCLMRKIMDAVDYHLSLCIRTCQPEPLKNNAQLLSLTSLARKIWTAQYR